MIPHIYTTTTADGIDELVARFASKYSIIPSHIIQVTPEKNELTVEQIHVMKKDIQVQFSATVLLVILGVDDSSTEVQNSLLKCLEEEAERIQFLLLVKNPARLLPTIISRCTIEKSILSSQRDVNDIHYSDLFAFDRSSDVTKETAVERIDAYIQSSSLKNHTILQHLLQIRKLIIDNNMNPVLALDNILIFLMKTGTMNVSHEK